MQPWGIQDRNFRGRVERLKSYLCRHLPCCSLPLLQTSALPRGGGRGGGVLGPGKESKSGMPLNQDCPMSYRSGGYTQFSQWPCAPNRPFHILAGDARILHPLFHCARGVLVPATRGARGRLPGRRWEPGPASSCLFAVSFLQASCFWGRQPGNYLFLPQPASG